MTNPLPISGYVLAGGRSSRMGKDKALLKLAGKPLIEHAVKKLRRVCADVHILSANPALPAYVPLVADLHPGCGPVGGMEAALTHSSRDWNLFLAVDLPFLPSAFIYGWATRWMHSPDDGARLRIFSDGGRPHPAFCLLHKDVLPYLSEAIRTHDLRLMRVFETAGRELALRRGYPAEAGLWNLEVTEERERQVNDDTVTWGRITASQQAARTLWFANLNTPEDFALAEAHTDALDT